MQFVEIELDPEESILAEAGVIMYMKSIGKIEVFSQIQFNRN